MSLTWSSIPEGVRGTLLAVAGGAIGWFASQYMDYRTAYKESLQANYERFDEATSDVSASLKAFADIARGAKEKNTDDVQLLQARVYAAVSVAEDLRRRLGAADEDFERLRKAAVSLKHASDSVTGPKDAKNLVAAANDFLLAEKLVRDEVVKELNAFAF